MKAWMTWFFAFSLLAMLIGRAAELEDFCVVQDSDGHANIREKAELESKVIARVDHGQLVWIYLGGMTKWPQVLFMDKEGKEHTGFIHSSRLKALTDFEHFSGKTSEENQTETIEKGDLKVEVALKPFDPDSHKLAYQEDEFGERYLTSIDGLPYWGTDGALPREQYQKVTIQKDGKTTTVPDEALKNLYNPGLYPGNTTVTINPEDDAIYITSFNSDGAGAYLVGFVLKGGKFKNRAVFSPF